MTTSRLRHILREEGVYANGAFGHLDQGVMSGLLTGTAFTKQFPAIDTTDSGNGSSSLQGTVVAIYEIGCFFGALLAFGFAEPIGRRWSIMIGCMILTVGAAIQCSAYSVAQLIVGRIVAGVGNGINTATIRTFYTRLLSCVCIRAWSYQRLTTDSMLFFL